MVGMIIQSGSECISVTEHLLIMVIGKPVGTNIFDYGDCVAKLLS